MTLAAQLGGPRGRALGALVLLAALVLAGRGGTALPGGLAGALLLLGGAGAAAGAWWARGRAAGPGGGFRLPERLVVHQRAGLSGRCGLALVEADGARYLVVYGEGFATVRRAAGARRRGRARRAGERACAPAGAKAGEGVLR
jgi:hypothetical protein